MYIRKEEVASKNKEERSKWSPIWRYGEALIREGDRKVVYYCYICERERRSQKLPIMSGNKGGLDYMESHKIDRKSGEPKPKKQQQSSTFNLVSKVDFKQLKGLLIRWIVCCQLAFFMLENDYFRELVAYLNQSFANLLPRASSTIRQWILEEYEEQKQRVKGDLLKSLSHVSLSFDIWTASNWFSIISICVYWISSEGKRERRLLAYRRLIGGYSSENQAEAILAVITEYEIRDRVAYFVYYNATFNDTAIELVLRELNPRITAKDIASRRLRCFGHITNLCA